MRSSNSGSKRSSHILSGIIFLLIGIAAFTYLIYPNLQDWQDMHYWEAIEGELLELRLDSDRSGKSTTYAVRARYRYVYQGHQYTNNRVGIIDFGYDSDSYHQDLYQSLRTRDKLTLWIDPQDPARSVIDREMRWGLLLLLGIFPLAFGGFGLYSLIAATSNASRSGINKDGSSARHAQGTNRIVSGSIGKLVMRWFLGLASSTAIVALTLLNIDQVSGAPMLILLILVFGGASFALLFFAVRSTLEYRRFGRLELVLDPYPGAIGGEFGATMLLRERFDSQVEFPVSLTCQHTLTTGSGKNSSTSTTVVWQKEGNADARPHLSGTQLHIRIAVPEGLPESQAVSRDYHRWTLHIEGKVPGINLRRDFTVPMRATETPSETPSTTRFAVNPSPSVPLDSGNITIRGTSQGTEFVYPLGRHKWLSLFMGIMGFILLMVALPAGLLLAFGTGFSTSALVVMLIFGLPGLYLFSRAFYLPLRRLTVTISASGITAQRKWLGIPVHTRQINRDEFSHIEPRQELVTYSGSKPVVHYHLMAIDKNKRGIIAGEGLRGDLLATMIIDRIHEAMGVPRP